MSSTNASSYDDEHFDEPALETVVRNSIKLEKRVHSNWQ